MSTGRYRSVGKSDANMSDETKKLVGDSKNEETEESEEEELWNVNREKVKTYKLSYNLLLNVVGPPGPS